MIGLTEKLQEMYLAYGNEVFFDEGRLEDGLKDFLSAQDDGQKALAWCLAQKVYYRFYADQNLDHARFLRYFFIQSIAAETGAAEQEATEVVDAFVALSDKNKKRDIWKDTPEGAEKLYENLWSYISNYESGNYDYALSGLLRLAEHTPVADYYAGMCLMKKDPPDAAGAVARYIHGAQYKERDCLYQLGVCHIEGRGVPADEDRARLFFLEASQNFHPDGLFFMGVLLYNGYKDVAKNLIRSLFCLSWAGRQGHVGARYFLAAHYKDESNSGKVTNAVPFFTEATVSMAEAYYEVARLYDTGSCLIKDEALARANYMEALRYGSMEAAKVVKARFMQDGGAEDESQKLLKLVSTFEAKSALQKAANSGDVQAQYDLGTCYLNGIGLERNYSVALSWFRRGAMQDDEKCKLMVAVCNYRIGSGYFDAVAKERAAKGISFIKRALETPEYLDETMLCDCHYCLGMAAYEGMEGRKDADAGQRHMQYPLERNYLKAVMYMARLYEEGGAVQGDWTKVFSYYLQAYSIAGAETVPLLQAAYESCKKSESLGQLDQELVKQLAGAGVDVA